MPRGLLIAAALSPHQTDGFFAIGQHGRFESLAKDSAERNRQRGLENESNLS
jgi:hypothetical protein